MRSDVPNVKYIKGRRTCPRLTLLHYLIFYKKGLNKRRDVYIQTNGEMKIIVINDKNNRKNLFNDFMFILLCHFDPIHLGCYFACFLRV